MNIQSNHKTRRAAKYKARGMIHKAECAATSSNNRSKRERGKQRLRLGWRPGGENKFMRACHYYIQDYMHDRT